MNDSYFDLPLVRHSSGKIIPFSCHCKECHEDHREGDEVECNAKFFANDFPCCVEEYENKEKRNENIRRENTRNK